MSLPVAESPTSARPPKVLIPRLERRPDDNASRNPPRSSQRPRVPRTSKACLSCRQRKVKCNGGQPQCTNCIGNDKPCVYPQARRDRLRTVTEQNREMVSLLRDLRGCVPDERRQQIDDLLGRIMDDYSDAPSPSDRTPYTDSETRYPELHGTSEAGMNENMNMNDSDTHGDTHFDPASHLGEAADFRHAHNLAPEIIRSGNIRPSSDIASGIHMNPWPLDPSLQPQRQPQPDAAEVRPPALYTGEPGGGLDYTISPYELAHIENINAGYMDSTQRTFGESSADAMTRRPMQRREGDEW